MPVITVRIPDTAGSIARVVGWIVATKRKRDPLAVPPPKRKQFVHDYDEGVWNPVTSEWVLTLDKAAGPKIRRNVLYVTALNRRGRIVDRIVRICKK